MDSCPFATEGANMPAEHPAVLNATKTVIQEVKIPQPPPHFLLGNLPDIDPGFPTRSYQHMADLYGEIYQLDMKTNRTLVVSTQQLVNEACDQDRFAKTLSRVLMEVRALMGDGIFTAAHEDGPFVKREENWWKAHRLLIPAFGPVGLRKLFDDMLDISSQMVLKWDRMAGHTIDTSDDFTRLAFDTIGLCSFGYRFNEFYTDDAHPFAFQMANVLKLSGQRASRTDLQNALHMWEERGRQADTAKMHSLCREIVNERKSNPKPGAKDLLNVMLNERDRQTGERLSDENIIYQMVTFLAAGHETTSATLSFMWYYLLKNPRAFLRAQAEVDSMVGDHVVSLDMLPKLSYIDACIKETLRLNPPISTFTVGSKQDTTLLNGKYHVKKGENILCNLKGLHRDPAVWGADYNEFKPERFLDGKFAELPPNSWKPFGNGMRACIGRGFAEQEMILNTAMILQRFMPEMVDPGYELRLKSTLTVKPEGFFMRVRRRPGKTALTGIPGGMPHELAKMQDSHDRAKQATHGDNAATKEPIQFFFGGNSGTCEGFSQTLDERLAGIGYKGQIAGLDAATDHLSTEAINIIITASYEGKPPDNAKLFVRWLESLEGSERLKGVKYAVFGVGNSDWAQTFHRIPKLVDQKLAELGAIRVVGTGYSNVKTDLMGPFDDWTDALIRQLGSNNQDEEEKSTLQVKMEVSKLAHELGGDNMGVGTVLENRQLADTSMGLEKRHLELRLPDGMTYEAGDYLVILPKNPDQVVSRVMRFFKLAEHTRISFSGSKKKFLPTEPTNIAVFLHDHVELSTPITKRQLRTLTSYATDSQKPALQLLQDESTWTTTQSKRYTILDILEEHPIPLPFAIYTDMLLPLTPRQYSISSSPLAPSQSSTISITYDVHTSPSLSGHGTFSGVCSTYLASRRVGDSISCFVRPTNINFRLPTHLETPVIMFAAGTGIAPMRAFIQERATLFEAGRKLGPAVLFFGCRDEERDFLYKEELRGWEEKGIVKVYAAFSRGTEGKGKYVQDVIWEQREEIAEMFGMGGKVYLCGSAAKLGVSCADVCRRIYREKTGKGEEEAVEWLERVKSDRYVSDVY